MPVEGQKWNMGLNLCEPLLFVTKHVFPRGSKLVNRCCVVAINNLVEDPMLRNQEPKPLSYPVPSRGLTEQEECW